MAKELEGAAKREDCDRAMEIVQELATEVTRTQDRWRLHREGKTQTSTTYSPRGN
jgi:5-enolpyruvylshikimate-3-phosphate synthase